MSGLVAKKKLMFLLMDDQNRSYYWDGSKAVTQSAPIWLQQNPENWKNITLKFATNQKYFSTLRSFTDPIKFVEDGADILRDRFFTGAGTEEVMYMAMMIARPDLGLNYYKLEYKSRIDFSKFKDDPRTGVTVSLLQDDVFALVQANENTIYSIECNSGNPSAVKVLFDGVALQDRLNYEIDKFTQVFGEYGQTLPISFISNDGDNINTIIGSQVNETVTYQPTYLLTSSNYLCKFTVDTVIRIKGRIAFKCDSHGYYYIYTNWHWANSSSGNGASGPIILANSFNTNDSIDRQFDLTFTLPANLGLFIMGEGTSNDQSTITHSLSSISLYFQTKANNTIAYAIRPLDYLQQLVAKITDGQFTADSNYFRNNNKKVRFSGSSLRGYSDAKIQSSFADFFNSYNVPYNLALTVKDNVLWIEPKEDLYNNNNQLLDLGEVSKVEVDIATEYIYSAVQIGYTKQIYQKRNGRYETNCIHSYKTPINNVINSLSLISKDRTDSFGMEFIRSLSGQNSTDDKGDKEVFNVMISDEVGKATGEIPTAIIFNIDTFMLDAPIIQVPTQGATIYNTNPTISGSAQPFKTITVYIDGQVDGTTISDANGYWSYTISKVLQTRTLFFNGQHTVEATQSDSLSTGAFSQQIVFTVDVSLSNTLTITSPTNNDTLYNNLPLIKGYGKPGDTITLKDNGVLITTVVPDSSGYWQHQKLAPFTSSIAPGTAHIITAISLATGTTSTANILVIIVATPLITSIIQNQTIYTGTPLLKGVAAPGATVGIYIDGGSLSGSTIAPDATVTADANGDWQWQYNLDYDLSTRPFPVHTGAVVPMSDGGHLFSTTPDDAEAQISISGFKLMRGTNGSSVSDFDNIILDDFFVPAGVDPSSLPDTLGRFLNPSTLYNIIDTSPLRCLLKWGNFINGGLFKQAGNVIKFNGAEMNSNLSTSKNAVVINENQDINVNDLSAPFFMPIWLNFTTKVDSTFNDIMTGVNNSGYIRLERLGVELFALPIGTMSVKPATDQAQQWKLLCSAKTSLSNLLKLNNTGQSIQIGKNMIYISDLNPLHPVKYDFTPPAKYNNSELYDTWFRDRFLSWTENPDYLQKWQKTDNIPLQIITNQSATLTLQMFNCDTKTLVDTITFNSVTSPLSTPNVLMQCDINLSGYDEGRYVFILKSGSTEIAIFEKIWLKESWPATYLIEYGTKNNKDKVDYYFSVGIKPMIRVEAFWSPFEPMAEVDNYEDESGDYETLRGIPLKKRTLTLGGSPDYIPDWMVLKLNQILLLNKVSIENTLIARYNDSKLEKSDEVPGYPMNYYKIDLVLATNETGFTFLTPADTNHRSTTFTLDGEAFGLDNGQIITATIDN